jgi:hypothetical protein
LLQESGKDAEGERVSVETGDARVGREQQPLDRFVGFLSGADLDHAMGIAAIAGQLAMAADIVALRDMSVLVAFLEDKSDALHRLAVETVIKFAAGRAVAQSMMEMAAKVGEMACARVRNPSTGRCRV